VTKQRDAVNCGHRSAPPARRQKGRDAAKHPAFDHSWLVLRSRGKLAKCGGRFGDDLLALAFFIETVGVTKRTSVIR